MSKKPAKLKAEKKEPLKGEVRLMAKKLGVSLSHRVNVAKPAFKTINKEKEQLIKEIQAQEGNAVCYKTTISCQSTGCLWFKSCQ